MIRLSTPIAQYGLTGALLWIGQLLIFSLFFGSHWVSWTVSQLSGFADALKGLPPSLNTLLQGFFGALAVVAVFCAGLLLDLLSGFLKNRELDVLQFQMREHHHWLRELFDCHGKDFAGDYTTFVWGEERPGYFSSIQGDLRRWIHAVWLLLLRQQTLKVWKSDSLAHNQRRRAQLASGSRCLAFLEARVNECGSDANIRQLGEQMQRFSINRAATIALLLLGIESYFALYAAAAMWKRIFLMRIEASGFQVIAVLIFTLVFCVLLPVLSIALGITRETANRMYSGLLSVAYVTRKKGAAGAKEKTGSDSGRQETPEDEESEPENKEKNDDEGMDAESDGADMLLTEVRANGDGETAV